MKKNPLLPYKFWDEQSLGTDATSSVFDIRYQDNITFQLICSGTPSGVFYVQGCNNYETSPMGTGIDAGDWVDIASATVVTADDVILDGNQLGFHFVRIFYDRTASTGTVTGYVTGKQV